VVNDKGKMMKEKNEKGGLGRGRPFPSCCEQSIL
jgi:hypothetical protein